MIRSLKESINVLIQSSACLSIFEWERAEKNSWCILSSIPLGNKALKFAVSSKSTEFSQVAVNPLNLQRLHSALCKSTSSFDWRQTNFKMPYHLKLSFGCILYNDMMHHMASPVFSDPNRDPMPLFSSQNLLPRCYLDSKFCDEGTAAYSHQVKTATTAAVHQLFHEQ